MNSIKKYIEYDGFVVLHGTDTMAYTASAISFLIEGLNKPVIFTGSQIPIGIRRTDAKENLITSIEIASSAVMRIAKGRASSAVGTTPLEIPIDWNHQVMKMVPMVAKDIISP